MFIMINTWITLVVTAKKIFYTQPQNSDKQDLNKKVINTVKTIFKIIILKWPNNIHMQMFYLSFYFSVLMYTAVSTYVVTDSFRMYSVTLTIFYSVDRSVL